MVASPVKFTLVPSIRSQLLTYFPFAAKMDDMDEGILQYEPDLREAYEVVDDDEDMGDESDGHIGFGGSEDDDVGPMEELDEHGVPKPAFNPIALGLKEINGLAHFRVSSYKPGNGVEELVNDDIDRYWQSDGVQPHRLTVYFVKRVEIRALRFYVDYTQDESYTPTKIHWLAGTSLHDLHTFGRSDLSNPAGWIDVPLIGAGGGEDGNSLLAYVVQAQIMENHQNGKDTHIRGVKIYGFDDQLRAAGATGVVGREIEARKAVFRLDDSKDAEENEKALMDHVRGVMFQREFQTGDPSGTASTLDFMEDPVIR
ncbi:unnamed protein product [Discula destructiva]